MTEQKRQRVFTKKRRQFGTEYPASPTEFEIELVPGESITVFRDDGNLRGKKFVIGSSAEYDSYNFAYIGSIIGIGKKTVTIQKTYGSGSKGRVYRLDLNTFCWRNWNLDLDLAHERYTNWVYTH